MIEEEQHLESMVDKKEFAEHLAGVQGSLPAVCKYRFRGRELRLKFAERVRCICDCVTRQSQLLLIIVVDAYCCCV